MKPHESTHLEGVLQIDHERGVIYFHLVNLGEITARKTATALRICQLPKPIPEVQDCLLDITHMQGCNWEEKI